MSWHGLLLWRWQDFLLLALLALVVLTAWLMGGYDNLGPTIRRKLRRLRW